MARKKVVLAVVTRDGQSVGISCAVGLLRLQNLLSTTPAKPGVRSVEAAVEFVPDLNAALNLACSPGTEAVAVLFADAGFDPARLLESIQSDTKDVVLARCPLPRLDWDEVRRAGPSAPDLEAAACTFAAVIAGGEQSGEFVRVQSLASDDEDAMAVAVVSRRAVEAAISAGAPRVVAAYRLTAPGAGFFTWYRGPAWVDTRHVCTRSGSHEYAGCVGLRTVLR